jgi:hypothetical protein
MAKASGRSRREREGSIAIVLWQDHLDDEDGMMPTVGQSLDHDRAHEPARMASR